MRCMPTGHMTGLSTPSHNTPTPSHPGGEVGRGGGGIHTSVISNGLHIPQSLTVSEPRTATDFKLLPTPGNGMERAKM